MSDAVRVNQLTFPPAFINLLYNPNNVAFLKRELSFGSRVKVIKGSDLLLSSSSAWRDRWRGSHKSV
jgi:hypothetical protein